MTDKQRELLELAGRLTDLGYSVLAEEIVHCTAYDSTLKDLYAQLRAFPQVPR